jgi:tetratricopeptide (TPR) repeat protein
VVFVGREPERAQLLAMLSRVQIALVYGVPGVGKSSLAHAVAADWPGRVVYYRVGSDETLAALVDDMRRQLARGPVDEAESEEERLADLARSLDHHAALMVLDDVHRLRDAAGAALFVTLGRLLREGRLLATSRELLRFGADAPDRFEMRLSGIGEEAARSLWTTLDVLYGPSEGFDQAFGRSRGNPFVLRRAHAGDLDEDPIAAAIDGLTGEEQRIALALALADLRLPRSVLASLVGADRLRQVLSALVKRLVVDVDGAGTCAIHDLFREAIIASVDLEAQRAMHVELADLLRAADSIDQVVRVREGCRHLRAAGQYDASGNLLLEHAATLIRHGAAGELLRGLEAIPPAHRSPRVRIARARTLGRLLDLRRARAELEALVLAGVEPRLELKLAMAQAAWLTGDLESGEAGMRELLAEPLTDDLRTRALIGFAILRTVKGHGDEARRSLEEARSAAAVPMHAGYFHFAQAFTLWLDERDGEAEPIMLRALSVFTDAISTYRGAMLAPAFLTSHLARLGRFEEAAEALAAAEAKPRDDLRMRVYLRTMRQSLLYERGERAEALAELHLIADSFHRSGEALGVLWANAWIGRILFLLGRRREAIQLLDQVEREAHRRGALCFVRTVEQSHEEDPLRQIRAPAASLDVDVSKPGAAPRRRAIAGLRAAAGAEIDEARFLFQANAGWVDRPGYVFERACAILSAAIEASVEGDAARSKRAFEEARQCATEGGMDADLIPALREALGDVRVVTRGARRVTADSMSDLTDYEVVLDARAHELRAGRQMVSLKRRLVLRKLLYALAAIPSRAMSKEELAQQIWEVRYNPLVHDNSLFVSVKRLRTLLEGSGVDVELVEQGYRLRVPERFLYIEQIDP